MFFLNVIDCTECSKSMKLDTFDKHSKKVTYRCECGHTCECAFDLVGMPKSDELFSLNETGLLTYKCGDCNYFVREYLSNSDVRNKKIIDRAFSCKCKKCFK